MSIKIMFKLVIPFAAAVTLAVGFTLLVSAQTQARPDLIDVASGGSSRFLRWVNGLTSGSVFVLAEMGDDSTDNEVDEHSRPQYSASEMEAYEESPLVAVKTVSTEEAHPGEVIAYTITLTNTADVDVENVSLADHLADGLTELSSLESDCGEPPIFSQRTVSWSGTVLADMQCVISYHVEIAKGAEGDIINFATVTDPYGEFDTNSVIVRVIPYIKYLPVVAN